MDFQCSFQLLGCQGQVPQFPFEDSLRAEEVRLKPGQVVSNRLGPADFQGGPGLFKVVLEILDQGQLVKALGFHGNVFPFPGSPTSTYAISADEPCSAASRTYETKLFSSSNIPIMCLRP